MFRQYSIFVSYLIGVTRYLMYYSIYLIAGVIELCSGL